MSKLTKEFIEDIRYLSYILKDEISDISMRHSRVDEGESSELRIEIRPNKLDKLENCWMSYFVRKEVFEEYLLRVRDVCDENKKSMRLNYLTVRGSTYNDLAVKFLYEKIKGNILNKSVLRFWRDPRFREHCKVLQIVIS